MKKLPNHFFAKFRAYKLYKGVFIVIMLISNGTGHFRQVLNKKKNEKKNYDFLRKCSFGPKCSFIKVNFERPKYRHFWAILVVQISPATF
jgi:hypothetical protein